MRGTGGCRAVVASVLVTALAACGGGPSGGESLLGPDETVEGLVDAPLPRLDVVGLAGPTAIEGGGCVTEIVVTPGGVTASGPRWLVTFTLSTTPSSEAALGALLGDEECLGVRAHERDRIVAALGAIGPDTLDVTYLDPSGRRWLPTPVTSDDDQAAAPTLGVRLTAPES